MILKAKMIERVEGELTDLIYAALLGERSWQDFLDRLNRLIPGGVSTLFFHDQSSGEGGISLASGLEAGDARRYAEHYVGLNPWMRQVGRTPLGAGIIGERIVPTLILGLSAFAVTSISGIGLGVLFGLNANSRFDQIGRVITLLLAAVPSFWLALLLVTFISEKGRLLPVKSVGESLESVSAKYFKEAELWVKTKLPVAVMITDNLLPKDEFKVEKVDKRRKD